MSDDDYADEYGDTDPNNIPARDSGDQETAAAVSASTPPTSAGDAAAGYPVDGHPGWRAGVFGAGKGLFGMARLSDLVARPEDEPRARVQSFATDDAPFDAEADPRLMQVSDAVLDQEQNSWRWNDPEALRYDIDRKKGQLAQAQTLSGASNAADWGQIASAGLWGFGSVPFAAANAALGQYMSNLEVPRLQSEIKALQSRLNQLRGRSTT